MGPFLETTYLNAIYIYLIIYQINISFIYLSI